MHVHRPPVDLGLTDLYAAQAAKKAAEAKQAAEVRRKLLRASASIDGEFSEFVSLSVSERSGGSSGHGDDDEQNSAGPHTRSAKRNNSAGAEAENPLSIWA